MELGLLQFFIRYIIVFLMLVVRQLMSVYYMDTNYHNWRFIRTLVNKLNHEIS